MDQQKEFIIGNKDVVRSYVNKICSIQSRSFATNSYQTKDYISFVCYSVRNMSKQEKALSSSCKFHVKAKVDSRIDGRQCWKLKQDCFHTCTHVELQIYDYFKYQQHYLLLFFDFQCFALSDRVSIINQYIYRQTSNLRVIAFSSESATALFY